MLGLIAVLFAFVASVALGAGCAWLLYVVTKKRWAWYLTPLFVLPWLFMGVLALALLGFGVATLVPTPAIAPRPVVVPQSAPPVEPLPPEETATETP